MRTTFLPEADNELDDALYYSAETWGDEQAVKYTAQMHTAIARLASGHGHIRYHDDLYPGLQMGRSGQHRIFGLPLDDEFLVIAILHVKQDYIARILARLDGLNG